MTLTACPCSRWLPIAHKHSLVFCSTFVSGVQGVVLDPDTEDAFLAFGNLVADHFDADRQILAWSGAAQNPFPSNDSAALASVTTPTVPQLFSQLIAGNRSSMFINNTAWVPQVRPLCDLQGLFMCSRQAGGHLLMVRAH